MKNLRTYIEDLILELDEATTVEAATHLSNKFTELSDIIHVYRATIPQDAPTALRIALDADLEHWEGVTYVEGARAEGIIKEISDEAEDVSLYGDYETQVRDTYNGSVL